MKNKLSILFCFLTVQFFSQTILNVDTLFKSGPINKRINLVIMGDGYTTAEMPQFIANATTLSNYLFNTPPFSSYKKYFNVFAIQCPSAQSGVSHAGTATDVTEPASPLISVTNNFDTKFDCYGTHRSIYSMNPSAVFAVAAAGFPAYDQLVILGNSPEYGGTGGAYAVSSLHSSAPETVAHEMGHSFAGLADEYWAGSNFATEKPNMTSATFTNNIKWNPWLGLNGIGIYPFDVTSPANTWFRPHQNCKMRFLGVPFCSVCKETIIEKIHTMTNPIDDYSPFNSGVITNTSALQLFKTSLINPNPNTLKRTWEVNGNVVASNVDSVLVGNNAFVNGINGVLFTVTDTTSQSKDINHSNLHTYSIAWTVNYTSSPDVGIKEIKPQVEFSFFPNPASDVVNLSYRLMQESDIQISVTDMLGRVVITERVGKSATGEYKKEINVSQLKEGNYILALKINNQVINNKFIIVK